MQRNPFPRRTARCQCRGSGTAGGARRARERRPDRFGAGSAIRWGSIRPALELVDDGRYPGRARPGSARSDGQERSGAAAGKGEGGCAASSVCHRAGEPLARLDTSLSYDLLPADDSRRQDWFARDRLQPCSTPLTRSAREGGAGSAEKRRSRLEQTGKMSSSEWIRHTAMSAAPGAREASGVAVESAKVNLDSRQSGTIWEPLGPRCWSPGSPVIVHDRHLTPSRRGYDLRIPWRSLAGPRALPVFEFIIRKAVWELQRMQKQKSG